ncbi:MAG TPA: response regulator [Polyangiaceae bacterium]|jgi:two-component system KDP operon response regulator KdpE
MEVRGRILLADDDPDVQRAVTRVAKLAGYEIIQAVTGAEVERITIETRPELVILDIRFPDADGRDVLARLKQNPLTAEIPVLIWSGGDAESDRRIAIDLGAEDYIEKVDAGTLLKKIERVLHRIRAEHVDRSA